jgi:transposase-like protein
MNPESHTRQKWRELIERQRSGGMPVAAFCARYGIAVSSLYAWRRRLAGTPAFVEVAEAPAGTRSTGVIEVRLRGGRRLLVRREGFDRELLVEMVAALESLPHGVEASS